MKIKNLGFTSFSFSTDNLTVITDPLALEQFGGKFPKSEADVVIRADPKTIDKDNVLSKEKFEKITSGNRETVMEINGNGEFEISEVMIQRHINMPFYTIDYGNLRIVYIGLGSKDIDPKIFEDLADVEVLILPVGDGDQFPDYEKLQKIIQTVDPYTLIPCGYSDGKVGEGLKSLEDFLKHFGYSTYREEKSLKAIGRSIEESIPMEVVILK